MARDRFIYWKEKAPEHSAVHKALHDYFGIGNVEWVGDKGRFMCTIVANWHLVEIYFAPDNIDVMTRMAPDLVNDVADGITRRLMQKFGGYCEDL